MTKDSSKVNKLKSKVSGITEMLEYHEKNKARFKMIVLAIFSTGFLCFLFLWMSAPELTQEDKNSILKIPKTPADLSEILGVIERYNKENSWWVTSIWTYLYIL